MKDIIKFLRETWTFILATTSGITALVNFVKLWQGNQDVSTWVLASSAFFSITLLLFYIGFSKHSSAIEVTKGKPRQVPRFPQYNKAAKISLAIIIVSSLIFGILIWQKYLKLDEKVIILVADFYGPEPENYQVTDTLISQLNETVKTYNDTNTLIIPLNKSITEQEGGTALAKEYGKQKRADFVLWGRYSIENNTVFVNFNIENMSSLKLLHLTDDSTQEFLGERTQFKFRQRLSLQMSAFTLFVSGIANYEKEDFSTAYTRFDQSLNQGEWNDDIVNKKYPLEMRGLSRLIAGPVTSSEIDSSIADFTYAINEIDSGDSNLFFDRGFAYMLYQKHNPAIEDFSKALEITPNLIEALYDRGLMYVSINEYQKAIDDYTQIIQIEPRSYWTYYQRGVTYAIQSDLDNAILDFTQGIQLCPSCMDTYLVRGKAYADLGEYDKAILDLNKAIKLAPNAENYYQRGSINYNAGNLDSAIHDFSEVIKLEPQNIDALHSRGMTYRNAGDKTKAIKDFSQVIELNPRMIEAYYNRGNTYSELGELSKAVEDLEKAIEIEPEFSQAHLHLGHIYARNGDFENAFARFSSVIEINVQPTEGYCYRGTLLSQAGRLEEGLDDLNKAIGLSSNFDEAYYNRGIVFVKLENFPNAVNDFNIVLSISKNPELIRLASGALAELEALP